MLVNQTDTDQHFNQETFSAKQIELVRAFAPKGSIDPNARLTREEHLFTLNNPPERAQLFLTDLSANSASLLHALVTRGLVGIEDGRVQLSALGKSTDIVLGGDMNDRAEGFLEIVKIVAWLRERHAGITTIAGNHELNLIAALARPFPTFTPAWLTAKIRESQQSDVDITISSVSSDVQRSVDTWLNRNGGFQTVHELAGWYRTCHAEAPTVPENNDERVFSAKIAGILGLSSVDALRMETLQLALLDAFRAVRDPVISAYLNGLVPCHQHGSLLFMHAFLPAAFSTSDTIESINTQVAHTMAQTYGPWDLSFGYSVRLTPKGARRGETSINMQRLYHPGYELSRTRFPESDIFRKMVFDQICPARLIDGVTARGIEAVFRGHDPATQFRSERHVVDPDIKEFRVVHCDTESRGCGPDTTSYLYISPKGEVFTHFDFGSL